MSTTCDCKGVASYEAAKAFALAEIQTMKKILKDIWRKVKTDKM
jgi:hypothetical protein